MRFNFFRERRLISMDGSDSPNKPSNVPQPSIESTDTRDRVEVDPKELDTVRNKLIKSLDTAEEKSIYLPDTNKQEWETKLNVRIDEINAALKDNWGKAMERIATVNESLRQLIVWADKQEAKNPRFKTERVTYVRGCRFRRFARVEWRTVDRLAGRKGFNIKKTVNAVPAPAVSPIKEKKSVDAVPAPAVFPTIDSAKIEDRLTPESVDAVPAPAVFPTIDSAKIEDRLAPSDVVPAVSATAPQAVPEKQKSQGDVVLEKVKAALLALGSSDKLEDLIKAHSALVEAYEMYRTSPGADPNVINDVWQRGTGIRTRIEKQVNDTITTLVTSARARGVSEQRILESIMAWKTSHPEIALQNIIDKRIAEIKQEFAAQEAKTQEGVKLQKEKERDVYKENYEAEIREREIYDNLAQQLSSEQTITVSNLNSMDYTATEELRNASPLIRREDRDARDRGVVLKNYQELITKLVRQLSDSDTKGLSLLQKATIINDVRSQASLISNDLLSSPFKTPGVTRVKTLPLIDIRPYIDR